MSTDTSTYVVAPLLWSDSDAYWQATAAGELCLPRCVDTGRFIFPPLPISPFGSRRPPRWERVSGRGRIWSFIVAHPPLIAQFAIAAPYVAVLVELDEDPFPRVPGALVAAPGAPLGSVDGADVRIGAPVVVDLTEHVGDYVVPRWVLEPIADAADPV